MTISAIRSVLFLLITNVLWGHVNAQKFQMVKGFGGEGYDVGTDVAVDSQGNIFISGFFNAHVWFGDFLLSSQGCSDIYLVKLNAEGEVQWARSFGGPICDYSGGLCLDDEDNVYLAGRFQISVELSGEQLSSEGGSDVFIAKFDNDGNFIWVRQLGGEGNESIGAFKIHKNHLYMSGYFEDGAHYGEVGMTAEGYYDCFLMKLDKDGEVIWIKTGGGPNMDRGRNFDFDRDDNIYLSGQFRETATFGNFHATAYASDDVFICKYNQDGEEQWLIGFGGIYMDQSGELTVDRKGNIYFTGNVRGTAVFGQDTVSCNGNLMILKFDSEGNFLWKREDECTWQCGWSQIVIDKYDHIFLSGKFSEKVIIDGDTLSGQPLGYYKSLFAQMTENGEFLWLKHSYMGSCNPGSMILYNDSTLIMTGRYDGNVDFNDIILNYIGPPDIFLATMSNGVQFESVNDYEFLIYPNPAIQSFTIEFENALSRDIYVYTTIGELVYREHTENRITSIDVSTWSGGLYLVNILEKDYQRTGKLLKY